MHHFKSKNQAYQIAIALLCCAMLLLASTKALAENYIPYGSKFSPHSYDWKTKPQKGKKTFVKDPNVWVYTSEFAKRFGMPEEWIDDTLEGAQAVAYRIEASNRERCGYFGEKESCRPDLQCVFDVYLTDEDSAKLPWNSHKTADWRNFDSSRIFLAPQQKEDYWYWHDEINEQSYVRRGPTGLRSVLAVGGGESKGKVYSGYSNMRVREYRRDFYQGLDLIELSGCSAFRVGQPTRLYFLDPLPSMREPKYRLPDGSIHREKLDAAKKARFDKMFAGNPPHKIKLPDAYMDRAQTHDKAVRYERSLGKEVLNRLKRGEIDTQSTIPNKNSEKADK